DVDPDLDFAPLDLPALRSGVDLLGAQVQELVVRGALALGQVALAKLVRSLFGNLVDHIEAGTGAYNDLMGFFLAPPEADDGGTTAAGGIVAIGGGSAVVFAFRGKDRTGTLQRGEEGLH